MFVPLIQLRNRAAPYQTYLASTFTTTLPSLKPHTHKPYSGLQESRAEEPESEISLPNRTRLVILLLLPTLSERDCDRNLNFPSMQPSWLR